MKIKLDELARALEQSDVRQGYVDIQKGRVILLDEVTDENALDHVFEIEDDFEHFVPLPNLYDSEEKDTMRDFAAAQQEATRQRLEEALQGPGSTARFRQQVRHLFLLPAWQAFLHQHFLETARWWCEENQLDYEE
ncbi:MAG: hypothetical protein II145_04665 [Selenomonas sp.]|jgi:hypothetical protein|nr:hypothetical protein [Selenomonas sp.]MCI7330370.1 UPF0158 family protein [Selenomonadaceae bacterium]MDD6119036.1 UPF0158 family protein [Selenomonadaceae bacterium]HBT78669.1 hypothetical protein [Selenomonas sp.]